MSKSAGLIIGGKFVSAIFPCANDIGALTRNLWQLNFSELANFKRDSNKLYWKWKFGFRVAGLNFLAITSSMDQRSPRREWGVHYENDNKRNKKSLTMVVQICVICFGLFCIWGQIPNISPRGLIFRGGYYRRDFCVSNLRGLYSEGIINLEGLIFGILRSVQWGNWKENLGPTEIWNKII